MRSTRQLPHAVSQALPAKRNVLDWATATTGEHYVLTTTTLVVANDDEVIVTRPWAEVDAATWDSEAGEVSITWVDGAPALTLAVADGKMSDFVYALKERVDHSLVLLEVVDLPGGGHLRGAIRRNSDGGLFSQVSISGARKIPADIDERVGELESRIRASVGLP